MKLRCSQMSSLFFLLIVLLSGVACDSNKLSTSGGAGGPTDPNLSDVDNDVAANVGPVEVLVTEHVLAKSNQIRSEIQTVVASEFGGGPGSGTPNNLILTDNDNQNAASASIDLAESIECDSGGSRDIIGSATYSVNAARSSGTITGTFTILYDNCEDIALLDVSDISCAVTPAMNGELPVTISSTFAITNSDQSGQSVTDTTSVAADTVVDLSVTVDNTDSDQAYHFTYSLSSLSTSDNLNGTVSFDNRLFDIGDIEEFVGSSLSAAVCP